MKKTCFKCLEEKDLSDFYKHKRMADGHLNKCKECTKTDSSARREEKIDTVREYDRGRGNLPHRVKARAEYQKTDQGKIATGEAKKRWADRNPEKRAAHTILGNAIRDGRIEKGPCEVCGTRIKVHGHHEDYAKPLEVNWLCEKHHPEHHKKERYADPQLYDNDHH